MKRGIRFGVIAAICMLIPAAASAQMGMSARPTLRGVWNPTVGAGATYEVTKKDGSKTNIEMAVVGKESVDGKEGYWLEITVSDSPMGTMVMKSLNVRTDDNVSVEKMIMQVPNRPPMEMPAQMLKAHAEKQPADIRAMADDLGADSLTTPAGTFNTTHYKMKDGSGDMWLADKVGPYGLVKFDGKDSSMVVTKVTTDATDKITGTPPQPFNPMAMQGQRQQQ